MVSRIAWITYYRRLIILVVTPLILLPLILTNQDDASACGYVILVMGVYWITQVLPIPATALLPLVMLPLMGIQTSAVVAKNYIKDPVFLLLAGMFVAAAVEEWNLHKRIALRLLLICGPQPKWLLLGCILPSWILSVWIPNTSTVVIMMPIIGEVLQLIKPTTPGGAVIKLSDKANQAEEGSITEKLDDTQRRESELIEDKVDPVELTRWRLLCRAGAVGAAYASSIGGSTVLTGTGANVILKSYMDDLYMKKKGTESPLTYGTWVAMALPYSVLLLLAAWGVLLVVFLRKQAVTCSRDQERDNRVMSALRREHKELGRITFAEVEVLVLIILLGFIWFSRKPGFFTGWSVWFPGGYVTGTTPGLIVALATLVLPSSVADFRNFRHGGQYRPLLTWPSFERRVPWGVIILIGGGFAIADASVVTGLSTIIGQQLLVLSSLPTWVIVLLSTMLVTVITELTSNVAVTTLMVPILADLAVSIDVHPLYMTFPCTLASCNAFLLPVSTPTNAIAFAFNHFSSWDMMKSGFWLNLIGLALVNLAVNTWGAAIFNFSQPQFPKIAMNATTNITAAVL